MAYILVVDDERSIRMTVGRFLSREGYDVETAENADEAMEILRRGQIDVVVSDIVLPRITGVDLLKAIREASPRVQVIMMTGEPTVTTATEALRTGAFDYLTKPVSMDAMIKAVSGAVRLKALDDERERLVEENRQYQQNLERLVEERTAALRESEAQFRQAQKMEAIGRLAGGVAHDFNNLLTVIGCSAQFVVEDEAISESGQQDIGEIISAARRARGLTRQLLAFSRTQELTRKVVDLRDVVRDVTKMLQRLLGEDISVQIKSPDASCIVNVDPGQVEQVLMNLAVNARDAMPDGGNLHVEVGKVVLAGDDLARFVDSEGMTAGPHVTMSVTDTGTGMDEETQSRIFEPFFTTKEAGKGSGLGLSTVYGIVKQHDGYVSAYSELGKGTTFRIYVPEVETGSMEAEILERVAPLGKGEMILFVEDEATVRRIGARMIENLGYNVVSAADGESALELARQYRTDIELLLTDVIMPGMSGPELAEHVLEICPRLKVICASGYPGDHLQQHGLTGKQFALLQKPFVKYELARALRDALSG